MTQNTNKYGRRGTDRVIVSSSGCQINPGLPDGGEPPATQMEIGARRGRHHCARIDTDLNGCAAAATTA